jgi:hypothetical protein
LNFFKNITLTPNAHGQRALFKKIAPRVGWGTHKAPKLHTKKFQKNLLSARCTSLSRLKISNEKLFQKKKIIKNFYFTFFLKVNGV